MSRQEEVLTLEGQIQTCLVKLKIGDDKAVKNDLEFALNELNITLSIREAIIDDQEDALELDMNAKYLSRRDSYKSDAMTNCVVREVFRDQILALKEDQNAIKKFNRIHKWFLRLADHLTWRVIQANFDAKRMWY